MFKVCAAALAATVVSGSANAVNTLSFSFATPTQNISTVGGSLSLIGTVTASASNTSTVFINGDGFSASNPLDVNDDPFFFGFPLSLVAGQSYTGAVLNVTVPASSAVGIYAGSFYIVGGDTDSSDDIFGNYSFAVNVNAVSGAVPEPASWAMVISGIGMVGAAMRRKKVAVRFG